MSADWPAGQAMPQEYLARFDGDRMQIKAAVDGLLTAVVRASG